MLTLDFQSSQTAEFILDLHIATNMEQNVRLTVCFVYTSPSLSTSAKLTGVIGSSSKHPFQTTVDVTIL